MTNKRPVPSPEIDALIRATAHNYKIPYALLYSQVEKESSFNPLAVSRCGARGLMQIMPATWRDITGHDADANNYIFEPDKNLDAGARYLIRQYLMSKRMITCLPKDSVNACIDDDYWMLGLASYNGGFGYILRAINLCLADGCSQRWETVSKYLSDPRCTVKGKRPDYKQMTAYVETIWTHYKETIQ